MSVRDRGQIAGQVTVDEAIVSARADSLAEALDDITEARDHLKHCRRELALAEGALSQMMVGAAIEGATVRQIAAAAGVGRTVTHEIVGAYLTRARRA